MKEMNWESRITLGRIAVGGVFHALAPWLFGYADDTRAAVSNLVSGALLAVFGGVRAWGLKGWPILVCAVVAAWVLVAPQALRFERLHFGANEALWGGMLVLALVAITTLSRWFSDRPTRPSLP